MKAFLYFILSFCFFNQFATAQILLSPFPGSPFGMVGPYRSIASADLNRDGIADLITSTTNFSSRNRMHYRLGRETGNFVQVPPTNTIYNPGFSNALNSILAIGTADINKDGYIDAVCVRGQNTRRLSYARGQKDSLFLSEKQENIDIGTGIDALADDIALADFNNDGYIDAAVVGWNATSLVIRVVLYNPITDIFVWDGNTYNVAHPGTAPDLARIEAGDFDRDGDIDIIIAGGESPPATSTHRPVVFRNTGTGFTPIISPHELPSSGNIFDILVADLDSDGLEDLVVLKTNGILTIDFFKGDLSSALFIFDTFISFSPPTVSLNRIVAADMDNDYDIDLIVSTNDLILGGSLISLRNNGLGVFTVSGSVGVASDPGAMVIGDYNGDGKTDLAVIRKSVSDEVYAIQNTSPALPIDSRSLALNQGGVGDGEFGEFAGTIIKKDKNFTVEGWLRLRASADEQFIFYNGDCNYPSFGANGFGLMVLGSSRRLVIVEANASDIKSYNVDVNISGSDDFEDEIWNHFAMGVNDTGRWFFFWNGQKVSVDGGSPAATFDTPAGRTTFGAMNNSAFRPLDNANIDEFRFWDAALSAKEIREWINVRANANHPQANALVAHYDFNTRPNINSYTAYDIAYKSNKYVAVKNIGFLSLLNPNSPTTWTEDIMPPVSNFGSGVSVEINPANKDNINLDEQVGLVFDFDATYPDNLTVSRGLDYPTDFAFPTGTPKVTWTIRNYDPANQTFSPMDMLRIRLTQKQVDEALPAPIPFPTISNYTQFYLFKRKSNSNNPSDWQLIGSPQAFGTLQYRRPGNVISDFSQLTIIHSTTPLAVRLLSFSGKKVNKQYNLLQWRAFSDIGDKGFVLEKSWNSFNFEPIYTQNIGYEKGKPINYEYLDKNIWKSAYYRLAMTDASGKIHYSNIIYIEGVEQETFFSLYPNPSKGEIQIQVSSLIAEQKELILEMYTIKGDRIFEKKGNIQELEAALQGTLRDVPKGLYLVKLQSWQAIYTSKLVKE